MNELSKVSNFVIELFLRDPLVNTISYDKTSEMDWDKNTIYPLINIDIVSSSITDADVIINYNITIVNQRDIDNEMHNDKIYNDNMIDNLNETHSIATRFINNVRNQNNDEFIDLVQLSDIQLLKDMMMSKVDGVRFQMKLATTNNTIC